MSASRLRAAALLAALAAALLQPALLAHAANATATNSTLQRIASTASQLARWLKTVAYVVLVAAAFAGVINYVFGKGPEWLARAALAAIMLGIVLWVISQVFPH